MLCLLCRLHLGSGVWGCLTLGALPVTSAMGGSLFPGIPVGSIHVNLVAVAATSLFGVLNIHYNVYNQF